MNEKLKKCKYKKALTYLLLSLFMIHYGLPISFYVKKEQP